MRDDYGETTHWALSLELSKAIERNQQLENTLAELLAICVEAEEDEGSSAPEEALDNPLLRRWQAAKEKAERLLRERAQA